MSDPSAGGVIPAARADSNRTLAIIVYALYLAGWPTGGMGALIGVIIAYVKRDEARGTIYEGHFANAIEIFWTSLVLFLVGCATAWIGIGVLILIGTFVWYIYRSVKGLLRAVDYRPYM